MGFIAPAVAVPAVSCAGVEAGLDVQVTVRVANTSVMMAG